MPDCHLYLNITLSCICAVPLCTPQLREELSQLSLLALYRVLDTDGLTKHFWSLTSRIVEMLHDQVSHTVIIYIEAKPVTKKCQNLSDQFPHLITDIPTVCFEAFHKADSDDTLTLLVYEAHYFDTLQIEASNSASVFRLPHIQQQIRGIIKRTVTLHPQRHRLEFPWQCYTLVARHACIKRDPSIEPKR